jgi:hypothetical protein
MGEMRSAYNILVWKSEGKILLENLGRGGKDVTEWVLENRIRRCGLDAPGSG